MARPSRLDDEGVRESLAELYASGASRQEMVDALPCNDVSTITAWVRDEQVQTLVAKIIRERANRITRLTDSKIEGRLQDQDIDTKTLLEIRKTFVGETVNIKSDADKAALVAELWLKADKNPALAEALAELSSKPDGA